MLARASEIEIGPRETLRASPVSWSLGVKTTLRPDWRNSLVCQGGSFEASSLDKLIVGCMTSARTGLEVRIGPAR